ncbi:MAG: hypothetical protein H0V66_04535 [Bdellovibrionales bacterium]|nr:hypothetical protein [Bdellovibrionales bacterium]
MKLLLLILLALSFGCTSHSSKDDKSEDIFDKIIWVQKKATKDELIKTFGQPQEIKPENDGKLEYVYKDFSTSINKSSGKVLGTSMPYWVNFDAYAFLKKRFKEYEWIETEIPIRTHLDYAEEIHKVEIPELKISFEYDNQDPLRRPMWIFFN